MAESSRTRGGDSRVAFSVHPALGVSPEVSTHESNPGEGGGGGGGAPNARDVDVLKKGDTLGRYLVIERLGAGAMGVVYAAYDPELDRKIAIKILRPHEGKGDPARRRERLVREAKAMAKLSHPNVGAIYDVGVHGDQVFLAMEFLSGGTLRDWVTAKKRPWREVVKMFIEVGKGLAGAHAEGLIHRDFKPDNVLIDKNGVPKVVDFGLVRLTSAALERSTTGSMDAVALDETAEEDDTASLPIAQTALAALTRTGALTGTPAYMAPEQFLGKAIDARTDQFAFCVALWEALDGERPFAGETLIAIAEAVTAERLRPPPKNSEIPTWLRRCMSTGLRADPAQRHPTVDDLLSALANDPAVRRRRNLIALGATTVIVGAIVFTWQLVVAKRQELKRQVAEYVDAASAALADAATKSTEASRFRQQAFDAFDGFELAKGEELWERNLRLVSEAGESYKLGIQRLEAATTLIPKKDLHDRTADAIVRYLELGELSPTEREATIRQLASHDVDGVRRQRLNASGHLGLQTSPPGLDARIETYDAVTYKPAGPAKPVGRTPLALDLAPGSYRVMFDGTREHVAFSYPVVLAAGERFDATVRVPVHTGVPKDFIYVPEGRFLFGSVKEDIRSLFLGTTPQHAARTDAFLIAKNETTMREWIDYLEALPPKERDQRRPQGRKDGLGGIIDLHKEDGRWALDFGVTNRVYKVKEGERFKYQDRSRRSSQDWLQFPVSGISPVHATEYAAWLASTGRVPNARLCTEREWERAARGADSRDFPHGNKLLPDDANFDLTYGRRDGAFGPDEVGSHPGSISPFGVLDMVGNVWDITTSVLERGQFVGRGSSFYQGPVSELSTNRDPLSMVTRDYTVGVRICADVDF
jgi:formylglycine-generating enzyme required for sulfatase activity